MFSVQTKSALRRTVAHATLIFALAGARGAIGAAPDVRSRDTAPIAPRGGVLMLPLETTRTRARWPRELTLRLADGRDVTGPVAWIHPRPRSDEHPRGWTVDPRALAVRPIEPADGSDGATGVAYLLVELPFDGTGPIQLGSQPLQARWRDVPAFPAGPDRPRMWPTAAPDRPDPFSPFEHWRWVLLASRLELRPPDPARHGPLGGLVARHYAALWRAGIAGVARRSPGVADAIRDALTRTVRDGDRTVAAWEAGPSESRRLLAELLDPTRSEAVRVADALAWLDGRSPLLAWPTLTDGDRVQLTLLNRRREPVIARVAWESTDEIPIAIAVGPHQTKESWVDRPPPAEPDPLTGETPPERALVLLVSSDVHTIRIAIPPRAVPARPPGPTIAPLRPALSLAELEAGTSAAVPPARRTAVQLRRRAGRWEAFAQCHRPSPTPGIASPPLPERGPDDATVAPVGTEAITLELEAAPGRIAVLVVPEAGPVRLVRGEDDGTLEVHRRSYADRWYARIVLPDGWLPASSGDPLRLGATRTHAGLTAVETGPLTGPPWRQRPGRAAYRLDEWAGRPQTPPR